MSADEAKRCKYDRFNYIRAKTIHVPYYPLYLPFFDPVLPGPWSVLRTGKVHQYHVPHSYHRNVPLLMFTNRKQIAEENTGTKWEVD